MTVMCLSDLGQVITGNTPSKSIDDFYDSEDICFVKPSDFYSNSLSKIDKTENYLSEKARCVSRIVPKGSILVTCIGIIGKVAVLNGDAAFNQQINAIIPDKKKVLPMYLAYSLLSKQQELAWQANAAVVPIINKSQFSKLQLDIPDIDSQNKIISVLSKVDTLTTRFKKQLEDLDLLIKSRFIEMFGAFPDNPKGWECCTIRDIVKEVRYGSSRPAVEGGQYPYLRMNNITYEGTLDLSEIKYIDVPEKELEKCTVRKGDVLFNRTNSKELVGKTCLYDRDESMVLAGFIIRVRVNEKVVPEFLVAFLNMDFSKKMLFNKCKAAIGQANINAQELQDIEIYLPPLALQKEFVSLKYQVDKSKLAVQQSLDELETLKKSLMQQYFG